MSVSTRSIDFIYGYQHSACLYNTFHLLVFTCLLILRTVTFMYTTLLLSLDFQSSNINVKTTQKVLQCMLTDDIYILKTVTTKCNI